MLEVSKDTKRIINGLSNDIKARFGKNVPPKNIELLIKIFADEMSLEKVAEILKRFREF